MSDHAAVRKSSAPSHAIQVYCDRRWPEGTGIGVVMRELEKRRPANVEIIDLNVGVKIGSPLSPLVLARSLRQKSRNEKGVFVSTGFIPPAYAEIPKIVIVHDLTHRHYYGSSRRLYYDYVLRHLYRDCRVICVSQYVRGEFLRWSGLAPERVTVVYNGRTPLDEAPAKPGASEAAGPFGFPYVFYPGNRRGYKNLAGLISAYAASALPAHGVRLVLTGAPDQTTMLHARAGGVENSVFFCGFLDEPQLAQAYRGGLAVAFVSRYEGFGLPLVEGMSLGTPVLTSKVTALPEIAGDAALLVDPDCVDSIREGLERIVFDEALRSRLIRAGRVRAQDFDWDDSAGNFWRIVREEHELYWSRAARRS
jgi:glycosyltransferase involved in cell wall biosynthesis